MISSSLEKALNEQIVCEIYSANLYLSMSFYFEKEGFNGFSTWMKKQSAEEMDHAYQMANFIIKRGGTAEVNTIDAVKKTWTSPLNAFEDAYAHECKISARIKFVREQVDEEATASGIVDRIKRMGDSSLFNLDEQYGRRQG